MSKFQNHDDDTCPHLVRASLLEVENARLRNLGIKLESMIDPLKAEVDRLRKAIMDSVEMRQRLREIEEGKPSV